MRQAANLIGEIFGKWSVVATAEKRHGRNHWHCVCVCGKERDVCISTLRNGTSTSCGCNIGIAAKLRLTKHGLADSKPHMIWCGLRQRCENPTNKSFKHYGARGISICERWAVFENFWQDMGPTWKEGLSVERVDVNGNYEPGNCTWIPRGDQPKNRRPSTEWSFKNASKPAGRGLPIS